MLHQINSSFGTIEITAPSERILVAKPSGLISLSMIKEDFEYVNDYPVYGFDYYVDLTGFVIPNPLNLYYLKKLNAIPRLQKYTIVTEVPILKLLMIPMKGILKYSEVIGKEKFEEIIMPNISKS